MITVPPREENFDNKESGRKGYTDQWPYREENGNNKEGRRRGYIDQGPIEG